MAISFVLPDALTPFARGLGTVALDARCATVRDALAALAREWPAVVDRILDEQGALREHVNVFVGDESVRYLDGLATPLAGNEVIMIVPAVSGG